MYVHLAKSFASDCPGLRMLVGGSTTVCFWWPFSRLLWVCQFPLGFFYHFFWKRVFEDMWQKLVSAGATSALVLGRRLEFSSALLPEPSPYWQSSERNVNHWTQPLAWPRLFSLHRWTAKFLLVVSWISKVNSFLHILDVAGDHSHSKEIQWFSARLLQLKQSA